MVKFSRVKESIEGDFYCVRQMVDRISYGLKAKEMDGSWIEECEEV